MNPKSKTNDKYLKPKDIADMLAISPTTLYKYIKKGDIKAIQLGNEYRISKDELSEFIQSVRVKSKEELEENIIKEEITFEFEENDDIKKLDGVNDYIDTYRILGKILIEKINIFEEIADLHPCKKVEYILKNKEKLQDIEKISVKIK